MHKLTPTPTQTPWAGYCLKVSSGGCSYSLSVDSEQCFEIITFVDAVCCCHFVLSTATTGTLGWNSLPLAYDC